MKDCVEGTHIMHRKGEGKEEGTAEMQLPSKLTSFFEDSVQRFFTIRRE
jgi:hypothetical protein